MKIKRSKLRKTLRIRKETKGVKLKLTRALDSNESLLVRINHMIKFESVCKNELQRVMDIIRDICPYHIAAERNLFVERYGGPTFRIIKKQEMPSGISPEAAMPLNVKMHTINLHELAYEMREERQQNAVGIRLDYRDKAAGIYLSNQLMKLGQTSRVIKEGISKTLYHLMMEVKT